MELEDAEIELNLLKKYIHYAKCKVSPRLTEVLDLYHLFFRNQQKLLLIYM